MDFSRFKTTKFQSWASFVVAILLAILLVVVGMHLIFFDGEIITPVMFYLISLCFFAGAAFVLVSYGHSLWRPSLILATLSLYSMARGVDVIHLRWLAIIAGLICILAAVAALYLTYPSD